MSEKHSPEERLKLYGMGFRRGAGMKAIPDNVKGDADFQEGYRAGAQAYSHFVEAARQRYGAPPRTLLREKNESVDRVMQSLENLREMAAKRAEEGLITPEEVTPVEVPASIARALEISVMCEKTGQVFEAMVTHTGIIRWVCSCGYFYEKAPSELHHLADVVVITEEECRVWWDEQRYKIEPDALTEMRRDPRTAAGNIGGPDHKEDGKHKEGS